MPGSSKSWIREGAAIAEPTPENPTTPLLRMEGIGKSFPGVRALDDVGFDLHGGEVHALVGENGAGKSTLIRVLTGAHRADAGRILLDGAPVRPRSPADAAALGIRTVYQEIDLLPELSVAENLFVGRQPVRFGCIDWRQMRRRARDAMRRLGSDLDVSRRLASCPIAVRQMVAIARALDGRARVLVLDEPTSSLDREEVERLFGLIRRLSADGLGVVFITHFIDQVFRIADRVTILRNGRRVATHATPELSRLELVAQMIGRTPEDGAPHAASGPSPSAEAPPLLETRGLASRRLRAPIDLAIRRGELVGVAGLLGSGRTALARLLAGLDRADAGTVRIDGAPATLSSPRRAIARGVALVPEDRRGQGLVPDLSVRDNIILALQAKRGWLRPLPRRRRREIADHFIAALAIDAVGAARPVRLLSGGNQQKTIIARWLATEPSVLILDEPTRGIDVGAKAEIRRLIAALRERGVAILFISSEIEELVHLCGRVLVMRDGRMTCELAGDDVSEAAIMRAIAGECRP